MTMGMRATEPARTPILHTAGAQSMPASDAGNQAVQRVTTARHWAIERRYAMMSAIRWSLSVWGGIGPGGVWLVPSRMSV